MACLGVHFAIIEEEANKLLSADGDEAVLHIIKEEIEERWEEEWLQETGQAWDAIHRCLTNGKLNTVGETPLAKCILGGKHLHQSPHYIVSLLFPEEVKQVADAIKDIDEQWFRSKYYALKKKFLWFDFSDYDGLVGEEDFQYSWEHFKELKTLFDKAAKAGRYIVFTVDQ